MDSTINEQQIAYYRARAGEYDQWFYRQGRFDRGEEANARWFRAVDTVQQAVHALGSFDTILELACGTGIWTQELVKIGQHVSALDASPEVLAINRNKVASPKVEYQQQDLFAWQPERQYDLVFIAFWLSHVPPAVLDSFLAAAARAVRPGGQIFIVDSLPEPTSSAVDHAAPQPDTIYQERKLNDGQRFNVVKVYYTVDSLSHALATAGFNPVSTRTAEDYFLYAHGTKPA